MPDPGFDRKETDMTENPNGTTLWITQQGACLGWSRGRFEVRKEGEIIANLPAENVESVAICGCVQVTGRASSELLRREVGTVFLSRRGTYRGRLQPHSGHAARLRQAQYSAVRKDDMRLAIARAIVTAKIHNQKTFLARHQAAGEENRTVRSALKSLERRAGKAENLETLRGLEGAAAARYFAALPSALKVAMGFEKRSKRPPTDPVNAMLSLGYTLLYSTAVGAAHLAGLDPWAGFYHDMRSGHAALASDLVEEYRTPVVDTLVAGAVNRGQFTEDDFRRNGDGVRLNDNAYRTFLDLYTRRLQERVRHPASERSTAYVRCMEVSARSLVGVIREHGHEHVAFRYR
jgi:CRISPR-associated endonuclease Cas1